MSTRRTPVLALAVAAFALLLGACGGDDSSSSSSPSSAAGDGASADGGDATADPEGDDVLDAVAGEDADAARDAVRDNVGLEGIASAMETALGERVEVDGETVHVYVEDPSRDGTFVCVVAETTLGTFDYEPEIIVHVSGQPDHTC